MSAHPTAYLVLASQRSGSTLLVESLRATGVAGEPQEFFQYLPTTSSRRSRGSGSQDVEDESILRLLDPLDEGKPDLAPAEIWRDYIQTVGRTPNGIWGGKLMWNQTPLLLQRAAGLPDRSGDGLLAAIRDVVGSDPVLVHVYRPDVVSQAVSFWRAVQTRVWRGRPDPTRDSRAEYHAGAIAHVITMLRAQDKGWRDWFDEEDVEPMRGLLSGVVAQPHSDRRRRARGARPGSPAGARTGAGASGGSALRRMGGPVPRRRGTGGSADMTRRHAARRRAAACSKPRRCTSSARSSPNWSGPVLLFSAGKDSIVLLRLAEKAFRPSPLPFPVMHVDTGHNFDEVIEFRDRRVTGEGHKLIVASVQESIDSGRVPDPGPGASRNRQQTRTLLDALEAGGFDAAFGGARRDEERARAKERILSFRDEFGQWDPRAQRPEPWSLYNGRIKKGEQVRVFPLSNWTELDVWRYIELETLELPSIYFAHEREVFERDGILLGGVGVRRARRR